MWPYCFLYFPIFFCFWRQINIDLNFNSSLISGVLGQFKILRTRFPYRCQNQTKTKTTLKGIKVLHSNNISFCFQILFEQPSNLYHFNSFIPMLKFLTLLQMPQRSVYTERQCQCWNNDVITLVIRLLLKTTVSLEYGSQSFSGATSLLSMWTVSLASSQHCSSVDADTWCKRTLNCTCILTVQESAPAGGSAPGETAGWVPCDPPPSRGPAPHGLRHHGHHEESHAHEQGRLHRRLRQGVLCWPCGSATFMYSQF